MVGQKGCKVSYSNQRPIAIFDIECYRNYFLICFLSVTTGKRKHFEFYAGHPLDVPRIVKILRNHRIVGFNSNNYDVPMLCLALRQGVTNDVLKRASDDIIVGGLKPWVLRDKYASTEVKWLDHIDLIEPAPSVKVGLKLYGGRLHSRKMQDLPIEPSAIITPEQRDKLVEYCYNDCEVTLDLYNHILPQLTLRAQMSDKYGIDLRSKSDAQIAEAVIKHELERIKGEAICRPEYPANYSFKYVPPEFISFKTEQFQNVLDTVCSATFKLRHTKAKATDTDAVEVGGVQVKISGVEMPKEINGLKIRAGSSVYQMGIGGLHSTESSVSHYSTKDVILRDADVAAFYPQLILVCGLYPEHLGPEFLEVYRQIREGRMDAKANIKRIKKLIEAGVSVMQEALLRKDMSSHQVIDMTLKIVLNGTFGKLGSKWSFLFAPNLMIQVTITGQLVLLMLIEELELNGISVVSANTDGIVSKFDRDLLDTYESIVHDWEARTGFEMEFTDYAALFSQSVNSYIAIKLNGEVKQKGLFAFVGSKGSPAEKNPASYVCIDAVVAYLRDNTPIDETIQWCGDVRRFLTVRRVTGGAEYDGAYLGKVVRWYKSKTSTECIRAVKSGNKVAKSDGVRPMMQLDGKLPDDLDYKYYYDEAVAMLGDLGVM